MPSLDRHTVINALESILQDAGERPVVFHTAIGRIGLIGTPRRRDTMIAAHAEALLEAIGDRTAVLPTFNYDYCDDGVYDVRNDPCQVGQLNEYVRKLDGFERTRTPIFNFVVSDTDDFTLDSAGNVFGLYSTFHEMVVNKATLCFYGADLSSNTFIHRVEEDVGVGYRYIKKFPGIIQDGAQTKQVTVRYRVRPLSESRAVVYDWDRLYTSLLQKSLMKRVRLGAGWIHCLRADRLFEHWSTKLEDSETFFLTDASRDRVKELYDRFGYPLTYREVEDVGA